MKSFFVVGANKIRYNNGSLVDRINAYKRDTGIDVKLTPITSTITKKYNVRNPPFAVCRDGKQTVAVLRFGGMFDWDALIHFFKVFNK